MIEPCSFLYELLKVSVLMHMKNIYITISFKVNKKSNMFFSSIC